MGNVESAPGTPEAVKQQAKTLVEVGSRQLPVPTLDDLGGINRPAVSYKDELETKVEWLRAAVLSQADKMEAELFFRADRARGSASSSARSSAFSSPSVTRPASARTSFAGSSTGGGATELPPLRRANSRLNSFGGTSSANPSRSSSIGGASVASDASGRAASLRVERSAPDLAPAEPSTSGASARLRAQRSLPGIDGDVSTSQGGAATSRPPRSASPLKRASAAGKPPAGPSSGGAAAGGGSAPRASVRGTVAGGDRASRPAGARLPSASMAGSRPRTAAAAATTRSKLAVRVPGEERLRDGEPDQALLASLRRVRMRRSRSVSDLQLIADVSFALLQPTRISDSGSSGAVGGAGAVALPLWRRRVLRAKWKAWWHLKFFMALTAAIKRRRRYAQAMPDNSSTYYVARLLGEDCEKFGECQEIHSEIALLGAAALRTIQVLYLGRHWRAKAKKMAAARRGREATMAAAAKGVRFADQGGGAGDASGAAAGPNAPLVATRAAGSYMEIHRHRRLVAAMMDKRRPTFLTMKHREDLDNITRVAAANMAMFVNRANGQWVEEKPWTAPLLLGASMLGRKEQQGYEQLAAALLGDGKIAVQIICADDEQVVVNTNSYGEEVLSELMSTDLWGPMSKMFPWKIPTGDRIEGLSVLARRVLQVLTDVELAGGPAAARSMKLVLCVASDMEGWLNRELTKHQFFTLPPSNVIVVVQPKFPGVMWDKATGQFVMAADADGPPRHTFGSGYAMLQLAWPGCAHTISPADGSKVPLEGNGSVLATLAAEGVEFLQTGFLSDWEALHNNSRVSGAANMDFLVPALYALDERGANMAMEVIEAPEGLSDKADALARHQQSWVLGPAWKRFSDGGSTLAAPPAGPRSFGGAGISSGGAAGSPSGSSSCSSGGGLWSCNVSLNDLQTPKARWLLSQAARRGPLASCCSRYLFSVQALSKILLGPNVFKHNIRIEGSFAFLDLDLADVTSMPGAKAVSVCCQARGPRLGARIHDRQLLQELVVPVAEQDMQGLFKLKACQSSSACAPVAIKSKSLANQRPWRIMLFVDASAASKAAFRMAKRFLTHGEDLITVVHVAVTEAAVLAGPGVLAEYDDPTVRDQVQHKLLNKIDARLSEAIRKEVEAAKPDLVVFGSDKLSKTALPTASGSSGGAGAADGKSGGSSSGGSGSKSIRMAGSSATPDAALGSLSLSLLMSKTILDVPLLVVKPTSSGEMLRAAANPGERPAMRAMMEVHTTSGPLLSWLMDKCDKARDRLVLARTRALDREGRPQQTSQRILMSMADLAHKRGFQTVLRPLGEGPTESIPEAVRRDKVDLLVVQAVQDVATPVAILDLLRACPTSVLIHRARPQDLTDAAAAEVAAAT